MAKRKEDNLTEEERYLLSTIQQQPSRLAAHSIKSLVNRLVSERGYAAVQGGEVIREAWDCVVGKEIAAQTKPGNLRAGTLHIHVADSLTPPGVFLDSYGTNKLVCKWLPWDKIVRRCGPWLQSLEQNEAHVNPLPSSVVHLSRKEFLFQRRFRMKRESPTSH